MDSIVNATNILSKEDSIKPNNQLRNLFSLHNAED